MQARVPGASTLLEPRRGSTGQPVTRGGTALSRFASPLAFNVEPAGKEVEKELLRIGYIPSVPRREARLPGGQRVLLTPAEHRQLTQAQEDAAREFSRLMEKSQYRDLPDTVEEGGSTSKEALARRVFDGYRDRARQRLYSRGRLRSMARRARRRRSRRGLRGLEIQYGR